MYILVKLWTYISVIRSSRVSWVRSLPGCYFLTRILETECSETMNMTNDESHLVVGLDLCSFPHQHLDDLNVATTSSNQEGRRPVLQPHVKISVSQLQHLHFCGLCPSKPQLNVGEQLHQRRTVKSTAVRSEHALQSLKQAFLKHLFCSRWFWRPPCHPRARLHVHFYSECSLW